mmetsp:Transcript_13628/g.25603  ORF Transcript_13628/g.25603 Transcript_13628/m.25603 type:complete len:118 (-) Transcript_13628:7393-7746(-)
MDSVASPRKYKIPPKVSEMELPDPEEVPPSVCGSEQMTPHTKLINQNPNVPLTVLNVSSSRPSVLTLRARKNKKPASFTLQVTTAADDTKILLLEQLSESKTGKEANAKVPVPNKSK